MLGLVCTIISMVLFIGFNIICLSKYGLLSCYSAYGPKWAEWEKEHPYMKGLNVWSLVTILTAIFLIPPMIITGIGSSLQFLCFFAPLYLFLVAFTPHYNTDKRQNIIHQIGAWTCVVLIFIWLIAVVHKWIVLLPVLILMIIIGLGTGTLKKSITYYLEMMMFLSTYIVLISMFI